MATTPDAGVDLSDADLDELVAASEGESTTGTTAPDPAPADPTPPVDDSAPAASDDALAADGAEEGTDDEAGRPAAEGDTTPEPAAPAPASIPQGKPFQFKASGGEHILPGALELPDGSVVIQKEAQADFRRVLANERDLAANFTKYRRDSDRKLQALKAERTDKDIENDAGIALLADVFKMTPEERIEWAVNLDAKRGELELAVERQKLERDRKALEQDRAGPQLSEEEQQEHLTTQARGELNATFQRLMALPEAQALTREEAQDLYRKWAKAPQKLVRTATKDDDGAPGIKKGQAIFDDTDVAEDFHFAVTLAARRGKAVATATEAARRNAALNADTASKAPVIPPTVARGKVPTAPGKKKSEKFDREKFMNGEYDDAED